MMTGLYNDPTLAALLWIFHNSQPFMVCGSRFFGDAKPDSDYDFVVEYGKISEAELTKAGFRKKWEDDPQYADENTEMCYAQGEVHIIVSLSLDKRIAAREHILKNNLDRHSIDVWDNAYKLLEANP